MVEDNIVLDSKGVTNWRKLKISDITNVTSGGTPSTMKKEYWEGNILWMNSGELNLKRIYDVNGRITEKGMKNSSTKLVPPLTVLIGLAGQGKTRGTAAINFVDLCINQSIAGVLPSENHDSMFLYYNLDSRYDELRSMSTGDGGRGGLNLKILRNLEISLPAIDEQKKIANVLSETDKLIGSIEKLIDKKKNIKQGTMQQLLTGETRLIGFNSPLIRKSLHELGEFSGGGVDKKIRKDESMIRLLNFLDVYRNDFIFSSMLHHKVTAKDTKIQQCSIKEGDLFLTPSSELRTDIALSAVAMENIPDAVYSYHIVRFRIFDEWDIKYRTYIFNTHDFLSQAEKMCEGSGKRYVITQKKFKELELTFTQDISEQKAIAQILSDMDKEIEALEKKLHKYKKIKQGMMQELLTGRIKLV